MRYPTPSPSTPDLVAEIVARIVSEAGWDGVIGATFPAVIKHGVALSAANVDPSWIGTNVDAVFTKATTGDVIVLNDADAAGIAEARFGAAKGVSGVVIMLTFGTGIGSALLVDGKLVPNTELGTSSWTATTRKPALPPQCGRRTACRSEVGPASRGTCRTWSGSSHPTSSLSAAGQQRGPKWVPLLL